MNPRRVPTPYGPVVVHDDETDLPPLLLLHGLGGDHDQALGLLPESVARHVRRIAVDLRAHGDTTTVGPEESLTVGRFAADVVEVLAQLCPQAGPVIVVGVSMGAAVTLALATLRPDLVRAFALVRPAWAGAVAPESSRIFGIVGAILRSDGPAGLDRFTETAAYEELRERSPVVAASLLKQFARPLARERAAVLEHVPASPDVTTAEQMALLDRPALVLAAPDDPVHVLEYGRVTAEALPDARFVVVPRKELEPGAHEAAVHRALAEFVLVHAGAGARR